MLSHSQASHSHSQHFSIAGWPHSTHFSQLPRLDAVCIGVFTLEFVLRLAASPATIGLNNFLCSAFNWIDVIAIAPFYVDVLLTVAQADTGGGLKSLAVLRIVRLARVLRVLKFSKSISWVMVLIRTVYKSLSAMVLIIAVSLIM